MKNILKKGSKFFLTALVILNSLMNTLPVHAEETTTDENDLDTIVELGNAEDVFKELTTKDGKPIENILVDEKKVPDVKIPSFTHKVNSAEHKKGTQKIREMSLDDRMKLKAEDPDYYATLLNDR